MLIITFGSLTNYGGSKRGETERKNRGKRSGAERREREREEDKKWVDRELRWWKAFMPVKTELWCDQSL